MRKALKVVLSVFIMIALLCVVAYASIGKWLRQLANAEMAPQDYTAKVATGAEIEEKYMATGPYEVAQAHANAPEPMKTFDVYYPAELETRTDTKYPVVVMVNGTGVGAARYSAVFRHVASWGFVVIGNQDPSTFNGKTTDQTLEYLNARNEDDESIFYGKLDLKKTGVCGHSQGGVGVFNAISSANARERYTCAVSLSPTSEKLANFIRMNYDPTKACVPTLIVAANKFDVLRPEEVDEMYDKMTCPRAAILRKDANHGQTLYYANGYVIAWFRALLMDDEEAANAFFGEEPEILKNELYTRARVNMQP